LWQLRTFTTPMLANARCDIMGRAGLPSMWDGFVAPGGPPTLYGA